MAGLGAVLLTILLFGVGVVLGQRALVSRTWTRPVRLLREPVPEAWPELVRRNFPLSRQLADADFHRLLKLVQVFLRKKRFEGAGGLELTDEIRVTIAAQACFLVLWLDIGLYPVLRTIIVYPGAVVPRYVRRDLRFGEVNDDEPPRPVVGQSWGQGVVVLSWDSSRHGAFDPRDGKNVVFHEFAHQLDQETGGADGMPVGLRLSSLKPWAEVLEKRFKQLARAEREGSRTVMDKYGATNHAEFFAVATETFFEKSPQLRAKRPDLYALLSEFYGVDPAEGLAPVGRTRCGS
jgi:Mlc titration factor MtfA (ptsG expression regulator)